MKQLVIILISLSIFSCKNNSKDNIFDLIQQKGINEVVLPNYPLWVFNRLSFEQSINNFKNKTFDEIARTSSDESAYVLLEDIPIEYGHKYKFSIIVKKPEKTGFFGLKIVDVYPERIDVVFDLEHKLVKGIEGSAEFASSSRASIRELQDGWLECSLISNYFSDKIQIIFGPTSRSPKTATWEVKTRDSSNNYIVPSSLILENLFD